jgi:exopolysaccharide production protein ExoZ
MRKQLNLIQASRALVPLFVILLHAKAFMNVYFHYDFLNLSEVKRSGGVYYFFALSGFMVYYIYKNEIGNQKALKNFLLNRVIRLYPLYWILTLSVLPIYYIFPSLGSGNERDLFHIIASLFLFPDGGYPILSVAWSLEHTMFFYLMFSLAFLKNRLISIPLLLGWISISILFSVNLSNSNNYLINFIFNGNNLIFLFGVACAFFLLKIKLNLYLSFVLIVIGLMGFPLSWINAQYNIFEIDLQIITATASIILILGLSFIDIQKDIKISRIVKFLGEASFSIYLTHFTSMSAISIILSSTSLPIPNPLIAIILITSSIFIGCIVFIVIERPLYKTLKALVIQKKLLTSNAKLMNAPNNNV